MTPETPRATQDVETEDVVALAKRLLDRITPGPWAWEPIAEKSNEWAVGQAFYEDGTAISGRIPEGEWVEEKIIERRLIGMNESGHANFKDAEFIAAAPRLVSELSAELSSLRSQVETLRLMAIRAHAALDTADKLMAGRIESVLPAKTWQDWRRLHRQALADNVDALGKDSQ